MWFRNLQLYRLPKNWPVTDFELRPQLAARVFRPCGSQESRSIGWIEPAGVADGRMAIAVKGHLLLALQEQTKLLPSSVVLEAAAEKAAKIEAEQGYKPGRKQMKEIREAVLQELLPRAFTRSRRIWVWIDPVGGWLGIDGTPSDADAVLGALRDTLLEALPVKMVRTRLSPGAVMTSWLAAGEGDAGFTIDQDCELRAVTNEKAAVRYVHHALDGRDVKDHLAAGNYPSLSTLATYDRKPSRLQDHHVNDLQNGCAAGRGAVLNRGVGAGPDPLALGGA